MNSSGIRHRGEPQLAGCAYITAVISHMLSETSEEVRVLIEGQYIHNESGTTKSGAFCSETFDNIIQS